LTGNGRIGFLLGQRRGDLLQQGHGLACVSLCDLDDRLAAQTACDLEIDEAGRLREQRGGADDG
jgi:hypothetical protein